MPARRPRCGAGGPEGAWSVEPAELEKLRENSHIHLDMEGRFWHEGAPVEHPRVALLFHQGLGRSPDGRPTLTVGRTWCYVTADGPLYRVRDAACWEDEGRVGRLARCVLRLDDASEEELAPATLAWNDRGILTARVKAGRELAVFEPRAQASLARFLDEGGQLALVAGRLEIRADR